VQFGGYRIPLGKLIFLAAQGTAAFPGSGLVALQKFKVRFSLWLQGFAEVLPW